MSKVQGLAVTLSFEASANRPPLEYEIELGEKEVISVGRAPKSDVVCTLSGISWNHLELRLADPDTWDGGLPHMILRDLSMNGTGIRLPSDETSQKMTKGAELKVPDGSAVSFPMRKPKAKGKEDSKEVIQQTFKVNIEPLLQLGGQAKAADAEDTSKPRQSALRRPAETQADDEPKRRRVAFIEPSAAKPSAAPVAKAPAVQADAPWSNRLAKGESLVRSARHAESRGRLGEAFEAYCRGLQHLIKALPIFQQGDAKVASIQSMVKENLERAGMVKQRQSRLKQAEVELP